MKTSVKILIGGLVWFAFAASWSWADTLYVDVNNVAPAAPYTNWLSAATNIQAAVDAAKSNDTVLVADGIYYVTEQIAISNSITLRSVNGSGAVTIDAEGNSRGILITGLDGPFTLEGITIMNGIEKNGSGLNIVAFEIHDVRISKCVFEGNSATNSGGGINVWAASNSSATVVFADCEIRNNHADNRGGGINVGIHATATGGIRIQDCVIDSNEALINGGGLHHGGSTAAVAAEVEVLRCVISNNTAYKGGGAHISLNSSIINSLIVSNTALSARGGGVFGGHSSCQLINSTVVGNHSGSDGGGVSSCEVWNSIVWNNSAVKNGPDIFSTYPISHSCASGLTSGSDGNINSDPIFLNAADGDYRLSAYSPCVDAGTNLATIGTNDLAGETRIMDSGGGAVVDMGAYEFQGQSVILDSPVHYVDKNNPAPARPYTNWLSAATNIQDAVNLAASNDTVWVTNGTYRITSQINIQQSLSLVGVNGSGTTTIDAGGDCRVLNLNSGAGPIHLKGFTITGGSVTNDLNDGGGIWGEGSYSINIEGCHIENNSASRNGGGMFFSLLGGAPGVVTVSNCYIAGNSCGKRGGGLNCDGAVKDPPQRVRMLDCQIVGNSAAVGGGAGARMEIRNCLVEGNTASTLGGGLAAGGSDYTYISGSIVSNCVIRNNQAFNGGGCAAARNVVMEDCVITGNTAVNIGGGINTGGRDCLFSRCLIAHNYAGLESGGIELNWGGVLLDSLVYANEAGRGGGVAVLDATVINCTVVNNHASVDGGGVRGGPVLNSIVWGNTGGEIDYAAVSNSCSPGLTSGVAGNINANPLFINPAAGDYRLSATSPCINWGNNKYVLSSGDLDGNPRTVEDYVDMGCYEYQGILGLSDSDGDGLPDDWEHLYLGGNADPNRDDDGDDHDNWCEWVTGMDPSSAESVFAITNASPTGSFVLEWPCVTGCWYNVLWTPNLTNDYQSLEDFIEHPQNSYTDTTHAAESSGFYKVEARMK